MLSPSLSSKLISRRDHQPFSGYPSRCCWVVPVIGGTLPRLTSSLLFVAPLILRFHPNVSRSRSCASSIPSHPQLRTLPRFSKRTVAPVPSDGGRTRSISASVDDLR